ncbi:hypothetical protein KI387_042361 [Taxus chinensis]|uniref:Integrase catalytic domain-containing protein n=1 Tax=Taxus chinensis TaxID=29808 RepID=A0AA38C4Q9_TAXCH|nr:hypothetical protein KI387_042361 [Taxus chinensis]
MQQLLQSHGLWRVFDDTVPAFTTEKDKYLYACKQDEALGLITLNVADNLQFHISAATAPKEVWEKFESLFGKINEFKLIQLDHELNSLSPSDFPSIEEFLSKFKEIRSQLKAGGRTKKDDECIYTILTKLKGPFSVFTSTFFSTMDALDTQFKMPSFEQFCERLSREQAKLISLDVMPTSNHALVASSPKKNWKNKPKQSYDKPVPSHNMVSNPSVDTSKPQNNGKNKRPFQKRVFDPCSFCGGKNHPESRCFLKLEALEKALKQHKITVPSPSSASNAGKGKALSARASSPLQDQWIFDSGATHHITHCRDLLSSISACSTSHISVGNSASVDVLGSGIVNMPNGHLNNVLYVPHMSNNLLSIYQICNSGDGRTVEFSPDKVVIRELHDHDDIVATGFVDPCSRLYVFESFDNSAGSSLIAHADSLSKLWHERFGHLNYRYLQQLSSQNMVTGLPKVKSHDGVCPGCMLGKQHLDPFPKGQAKRATARLELVHSDLTSFPHRSFSGAKYVLTFIDDFTRKTWVYFLKYKSDVLEHFKVFKAIVEKQSGHCIKILRTDNGGEYESNAFTAFCANHGIVHQYTVPHTPQQNGVAERKNRTLKEMENCMVQSKNMAPQFWVEAVNCANHIQNRMPHKAVQGVTPEEAWSGEKPDVSKFWVFGCKAWAFVPDDTRKTMEKKSKELIFVGHCEHVKAYRLFDPTTKDVVFRRDVRVDETEAPLDHTVVLPSPLLPPAPVTDDDFDGPPDPDPVAPAPVAPAPKWLRSTLAAAGDLAGDSRDLRRTRAETSGVVDHRPYSGMALMSQAISNDPVLFSQASGNPEWDSAMQDEYSSLMKNNTWDLVPLPKGRKLVRCKWVYKTKYAADGSVEKYKARLVAKGYSQVEGVDYYETFAPDTKMDSVHLVLSLAASHQWSVHQMDVKSAFLHGDLHEEIYMEQPQGFVHDSSLVCRLRRSLYGLKQAPRAWYEKMDAFLLSIGFHRCKTDHTVYVLKTDDDLLLLVLYVDDLLITSSSNSLTQDIKRKLKAEFDMTDMGLLHYFLGLHVHQSAEGISICQKKYATDLLQRFHMANCKPSPTPYQSGIELTAACKSNLVDATLYRQLVGSLLYLTHTRPDITFAVNLVSRFSHEPHESHWQAAKRILRYLRGTLSYGIHYTPQNVSGIEGFTDSDWGGCRDTRQEVLWLRQILGEFGFSQESPSILWCDNQSAIHIARNPVEHQRTKHIEIHMHFIRQLIQDGVVQMEFVPTADQLADIFTKPLASPRYLELRDKLGVKEVVLGGDLV